MCKNRARTSCKTARNYCFPIYTPSLHMNMFIYHNINQIRVYMGSMVCPYWHMYISQSTVPVPTQMRVYKGGMVCPCLHMYISYSTVPVSPRPQKWECMGWYCMSLSPYLYILGSCPHVPTSPEMRVYRGGVSVPVSTSIYHRGVSPCPHVPRNESV